MSNHIPFEIQEEIIKRVSDVKSLIRFRSVSKPWKSLISSSQFIADSVSKPWKSLISSSQFIADYPSKHHHLLVRYTDHVDSEQKYVSIVDNNDSFPQEKFPMSLPESIKDKPTNIVGSSQGLFLLFSNNYQKSTDLGITITAVLWNPSIRKSVTVDVPNVLDTEPFDTVVGFGVSPHTNDPMIVKITFIDSPVDFDGEDIFYDTITSIPQQVEVYTLSSRVWRSPLSINLPRKTIELSTNHVAIDGFIYWKANDNSPVDGQFQYDDLILSFDMITEEFTEVYLPDCLAFENDYHEWFISNLKGSLVVLESDLYAHEQPEYCVWIMEHGVTKSFKKLFAINTPHASVREVLGFRKTGEPIIVIKKDNELSALFVYDPDSRHINDIGIYGKKDTYFASSYMETLLLLDH